MGKEPIPIKVLRQKIDNAIESFEVEEVTDALIQVAAQTPLWFNEHLQLQHSIPSPSCILDCRYKLWCRARGVEEDVRTIPIYWKIRSAAGIIQEPYWLAVLRLAGFDVTAPNESFKCGQHMRAHPDGLLDDSYSLELKCVTPNTKVLMADLTWKPAGEIKAGDKLIAFDEAAQKKDGKGNTWRKWRFAEVIDNSIEFLDCSEIELEDGTKLQCANEHYWLGAIHDGKNTKSKKISWQRTDRFFRGNVKYPPRLIRFFQSWEIDNTREGGWVAGFFDGEGCLTHCKSRPVNSISVCQAQENNLLSIVSKTLDDNNFDYRLYKRQTTSKHKLQEYLYLKGGLSELLRFLGCFRPKRLLTKFLTTFDGKNIYQKELVEIKKVTEIGKKAVCVLKTSTGTFIAEGFGAHNSESGWGYKGLIEHPAGVVGESPQHYAQVQLNLHATGMEWGLYLNSPPDPGMVQSQMRQYKKYGSEYLMPAYYVEWIHKNNNEIERLLERAELIVNDITNDEPPPREFSGEKYTNRGTLFFPCGYCPFLETCVAQWGNRASDIKFV